MSEMLRLRSLMARSAQHDRFSYAYAKNMV